MINIIQGDCMDLMKDKADNYWDLAIVDPPYNVGLSGKNQGGSKKKPNHVYGIKKGDAKHYANHDEVPRTLYFRHLFRVSKHQIIWGSNYYPQHLYHSGAIIWDKLVTGPLSDCEIAFQSFGKGVFKYTHEWSGFRKGKENGTIRVHPNQKPIALYKWLLKNYAKEGDKILDTHGGSMSSAIACHDMKFDLDIIELDKDYYDAGKNRFDNHVKQLQLF